MAGGTNHSATGSALGHSSAPLASGTLAHGPAYTVFVRLSLSTSTCLTNITNHLLSRVILGSEMMALQGYDVDALGGPELDISQHQLADLAGNALLSFSSVCGWVKLR